MESGTTASEPRVTRGTFLKGVAATTVAAAAAGAVTGVAEAQGRMVAPYVKRSSSGEIVVWMVDLFPPEKIALFNKVYPNVKVTQRQMPYVAQTPSEAATLVTGVGAPDGILFMEDSFLGLYADVFYDVSSALEPYAHGIVPYKLAVAKQGGRTVGIPYDVDPAFLSYRVDLCEKAGVDVSKIRTYDDLVAAAKQVKERIPSCTTPLCFFTNPGDQFAVYYLEGLAWQQHTSMADSKGNLQLNTQPYTNALRYFEKIGKAGLATRPSFLTPTMFNAWNTGQTCFTHFADWWGGVQVGLKPIYGKIGIAPQPVFSPADSPYSIVGGAQFVVPQKAKRPDLGALFGAFMMLDPRAYTVADNARYSFILPASESLFAKVRGPQRPLVTRAIDEHQLMVTAAEKAPTTYHYPPWYARALPYIGPRVNAVLTGKMTADQAQRAMYQDVQSKVIKRYR